MPAPDVELLFDEVLSKDGSKKGKRPCMPAHSQVLSMGSSVVRGALQLQAAPDQAKGSKDASSASSSRCTPLPLPGTTYEQWLQVAPFLYPLTPLPEVDISNIEGGLCRTARLWSMPYTYHSHTHTPVEYALYLPLPHTHQKLSMRLSICVDCFTCLGC